MSPLAYIDDRGWLQDGALTIDIAQEPQRWADWLIHERAFRVMRLAPGGYLVLAYTAQLKRLQRGQQSYWYAYAYTS